MRTKHEICTSGSGGSLYPSDTIVPFGKHAELRKNEGKFMSARGKSRSRSGGTTPRCSSERSPSPKWELPSCETETPRTYLIKDSFCEPDLRLSDIGGPSTEETGILSTSSGNKFLSDIEEAEWLHDNQGNEQKNSLGRTGGLVNSHSQEPCTSSTEEDVSSEKHLLKGKAQVAENGRRGKAPMAFPTEDELPRLYTGGTKCESHEAPLHEIPVEMPAWFESVYRSLTRLDDQEEQTQDNLIHSRVLDTGASSSSSPSDTHEGEILRKEETHSTPDDLWKAKHDESLRISKQEGESSRKEETPTRDDLWKAKTNESLRLSQSKGDDHHDKEMPLQSEIRKIILGDNNQEITRGEVQEQEVEHTQQGTGWLWRMSLCASVSFVTWVLMNGTRIQCRSLFPTIRERDQPVKIVRRKPKTREAEKST